MNFKELQNHAPNLGEFHDGDATMRVSAALHALSGSWGEVCDHAAGWLAGEPIVDSWHLTGALGRCLQALGALCNVTATNLSMVATGSADSDIAAWQYNELAGASRNVSGVAVTIATVGRELGRAHAAMAGRLLEGNGVEYQKLEPVIREVATGVRTVANYELVDLCAGIERAVFDKARAEA